MTEHAYKTDMQTTRRSKGTLLYFLSLAVILFFPTVVSAHCPLCTAGAGILAAIAVSLGVPMLIISTLLGGFALAMGLWLAKLPKKAYFRYQYQIIAWMVYFSTVIPLWPVLKEYKILYAPYLGFDKYADKIPVNVYLVGIILGALSLAVAPYFSKRLTKLVGGKQLIPFQGIIITLILLVLLPLIIDLSFLI